MSGFKISAAPGGEETAPASNDWGLTEVNAGGAVKRIQHKNRLDKPPIGIAVSDETTALTTGTAKATFRMPYGYTLTEVRATLTTASTSGLVTVDINESGTTILSTKLTIDVNERTSETAATAAVISDTTLADDAEITIDIDGAGTAAAGLKVWLIGYET